MPRNAFSRTANVGTVGKNGLIIIQYYNNTLRYYYIVLFPSGREDEQNCEGWQDCQASNRFSCLNNKKWVLFFLLLLEYYYLLFLEVDYYSQNIIIHYSQKWVLFFISFYPQIRKSKGIASYFQPSATRCEVFFHFFLP